MSAATKKAWADPAVRARMSAARIRAGKTRRLSSLRRRMERLQAELQDLEEA